jgi:hypothetical protein
MKNLLILEENSVSVKNHRAAIPKWEGSKIGNEIAGVAVIEKPNRFAIAV